MPIVLTESPRKLLYFVSVLGLLISLFFIGSILLSATLTQEDKAKLSILVMVLLSSLVGLFFRRISCIDPATKTVKTYYTFGLRLFEKTISFDDLSTIHIRKEYARTQGADISRQANHSRHTPLFILIADLKGFGKGKRRIRLNRYFDEASAQQDLERVLALVKPKTTTNGND